MKTKSYSIPDAAPAGDHADRAAARSPPAARPSARRSTTRRSPTRVKTSLLNDPDVGGLRIDVDTFKGVVTLSGAVKTAAERDKAIALARKINGVTDVKSTLQINP